MGFAAIRQPGVTAEGESASTVGAEVPLADAAGVVSVKGRTPLEEAFEEHGELRRLSWALHSRAGLGEKVRLAPQRRGHRVKIPNAYSEVECAARWVEIRKGAERLENGFGELEDRLGDLSVRNDDERS